MKKLNEQAKQGKHAIFLGALAERTAGGIVTWSKVTSSFFSGGRANYEAEANGHSLFLSTDDDRADLLVSTKRGDTIVTIEAEEIGMEPFAPLLAAIKAQREAMADAALSMFDNKF